MGGPVKTHLGTVEAEIQEAKEKDIQKHNASKLPYEERYWLWKIAFEHFREFFSVWLLNGGKGATDRFRLDVTSNEGELYLKVHWPNSNEYQHGTDLKLTLTGPNKGTCYWEGADLPNNKIVRYQWGEDDEIPVPRYRAMTKRKKE